MVCRVWCETSLRCVKRVFLCTADGLGQVVGLGMRDWGLGMLIRREGWWWDLAVVKVCDGGLLVMGFTTSDGITTTDRIPTLQSAFQTSVIWEISQFTHSPHSIITIPFPPHRHNHPSHPIPSPQPNTQHKYRYTYTPIRPSPSPLPSDPSPIISECAISAAQQLWLGTPPNPIKPQLYTYYPI